MKKIIIAVMLMTFLCGCASKSADNSLSSGSTDTTASQSDEKEIDSGEYKVEFETLPNDDTESESAENDSEDSADKEEFVLPEVPLD